MVSWTPENTVTSRIPLGVFLKIWKITCKMTGVMLDVVIPRFKVESCTYYTQKETFQWILSCFFPVHDVCYGAGMICLVSANIYPFHLYYLFLLRCSLPCAPWMAPTISRIVLWRTTLPRWMHTTTPSWATRRLVSFWLSLVWGLYVFSNSARVKGNFTCLLCTACGCRL